MSQKSKKFDLVHQTVSPWGLAARLENIIVAFNVIAKHNFLGGAENVITTKKNYSFKEWMTSFVSDSTVTHS